MESKTGNRKCLQPIKPIEKMHEKISSSQLTARVYSWSAGSRHGAEPALFEVKEDVVGWLVSWNGPEPGDDMRSRPRYRESTGKPYNLTRRACRFVGLLGYTPFTRSSKHRANIKQA